jgi:hypothetical protein
MSSVVENLTQLSGRVLARRPHPSVGHWDELRVDVAAADPAGPLPNLLARVVGQQVTVAVNRDELPAGDLTGFEFTGPARLAGPDTVVAVPAGAGLGRATLTPPTGPVPTVAGSGFPADPPPDDSGGPRPVL